MMLSALRRFALISVALPLALIGGMTQSGQAAAVNNTTPDGDGILLNDGDSLTNSSTITNGAAAVAAVRSTTGNVVSITNDAGASITGVGQAAIWIGDSGNLFFPNAVNLGTFLNNGTVTGGTTSFDGALSVGGNVGDFTNNNTMSTTNYDTVYIHGNLTGTFTNTGSITAGTDDAVRIVGTTNIFNNSNSIINTGAGEVAVGFGGNVTSFSNSGIIQAKGTAAIFGGSVANFVNSGNIFTTGTASTDIAVEIRGTGASTVTNDNLIQGGSGLVFQTGAGAATVTNNNVIKSLGGATGTAIQLTAHNDSLTLGLNSQITGIVDAGGNDNVTGDTMTLGGTAGSASFNVANIGATAQYRNFENFFKTGPSDWTLTGTNAATMEWDVSGTGSVIVNGQMANSYFNMTGGTLAGIGRVGRVELFHAAIAPGGAAVGTLTTGNLDFASTSNYEVTVAGSVADKIVANGNADVSAGTLFFAGSLASCGTSSIAILTTTGTLTGNFTVDTASFNALLSATSISYDAHNVFLNAVGGTGRTFAGFTNTTNQASTAAALDAMGCGNQPYATELNALTDAQVPAAMDALSGEGHAAIAGALVEGSHVLADTVDARIQQAFDALDASGALSGYAAGPMLLGDLSGVTVWSSGYGGFAQRDGNGNAAATQSAASGLVFGADGKVSEDWRLGVLGGLGLTGISSGATSGTSLDASIGGYAGAELGVVTVKLGAAYTRHFIDTSRSIVFPGVNDVVTASYQAGTAQAFLQFSHDFDVNGLTLTPYAKFQAVNHSTDAFTEIGGAGKLSTAASVANALFVTLGVGAEDKFALTDTMLVTARGSVGWRHAFADALVATNSFAGGGPFSVTAPPIASDVAVISAGLVFDVSDTLNVSINYDGAFGSGLMSHAVKATAAGRF